MKKYKQLVGGIVIGALLATSGTAFAGSSVVPVVTNWVKFKFNGEVKPLPNGYTVINYDGHTYVPARFIAEELGADVNWDINSNTVLIDKKDVEQPEPSEENDIKPDVPNTEEDSSKNEDETPSVDYEKLPVSETLNGVSVELYSIDQDNYEHTKLYFRVKNTYDAPMHFEQESVYLIVDGKKYEHNKADNRGLEWKDTTWYTDLNEDDDNEGYVMIPKVPNDVKEGTVHVEVLQNDRTQKKISYDFNINWK